MIVPDYALDSLHTQLQKVIGGKHYYKFAAAVMAKLKRDNPECIYRGPYDEEGKRIAGGESKQRDEIFLERMEKRLYDVSKSFV